MIRADGLTFEPQLTEKQRLEVFYDPTSARYLTRDEILSALMFVERNAPGVFDAAVAAAIEKRRQRRGETREAP